PSALVTSGARASRISCWPCGSRCLGPSRRDRLLVKRLQKVRVAKSTAFAKANDDHALRWYDVNPLSVGADHRDQVRRSFTGETGPSPFVAGQGPGDGLFDVTLRRFWLPH